MRAKIFASFISLFLVGTMTAIYFEPHPDLWLFIALALMISSFLIFKNRLIWAVIFGFGCFFLAIFLWQNQARLYKKFNQESLEMTQLTGTVYDIPQATNTGVEARVKVGGNIYLVYLRSFPTIKYADVMNIKGKVKAFSADKENYLIKEKLAGEVTATNFQIIGQDQALLVRARGVLFWLRIKMNEELAKALPKEEAGLASGLILGEKALVSAELKRELQASGTSHIIALSGYNITIVLGLFAFLKTRASRLMNLLIPATFILSFVIMTGAAASIVRAAIMGFMPIIARYIGRPTSSFMAILFSAFVMAIFNPYIVLYDVGFQLSFMAMIGLVYLAPIISRIFLRQNLLTTVLCETLSAQLAVLPLIVFNFGIVSVVAPISNLLILLLVPTGMLVSFLTGLTGLVNPLAAKLVGLITFPVLKLFNVLIGFFGNLSFSAFQLKIDNPLYVLISYCLMFDLLFLLRRKRSEPEV